MPTGCATRFAADPRAGQRAARTRRHRRDPELDQSRARRLLRRPGRPGESPAPGARRRLREGSRVLPHGADGLRFAQEHAAGASPGTATPKRCTAIRCNCATPGLDPAARYKVRFTSPATARRAPPGWSANGRSKSIPMRKKELESSPWNSIFRRRPPPAAA